MICQNEVDAVREENIRLKAALVAAAERLDASLFSNAEHSQARAIISTALGITEEGET